jgi:hypothetical protein
MLTHRIAYTHHKLPFVGKIRDSLQSQLRRADALLGSLSPQLWSSRYSDEMETKGRIDRTRRLSF